MIRRVLSTMGLSLMFAVGAIAPSAAQPPPSMELPWTDVAPERVGDVVRTAAIGAADTRIGRFGVRRAAAREAARRRAQAALHVWVDDALAQVRAHPRDATAVHEAVDREIRTRGVRPLVDGGAVVVVEVPVSALRSACSRSGLPWVDE